MKNVHFAGEIAGQVRELEDYQILEANSEGDFLAEPGIKSKLTHAGGTVSVWTGDEWIGPLAAIGNDLVLIDVFATL